jgi:hypothetical protein
MAAPGDGIIRIVPLLSPEAPAPPAAPQAAGPQLTYRGGPLLTAVKVFTVFWGSAWQDSSQSQLIQDLNAFFDSVLTSSLIDQLGEYSVSGQSIGHGQRIGTAIVTSSDPGSSVADSDIQTMLQQQIGGNQSFPQPDGNTLYFVYLPSGVTVTLQGSQSCSAFCGYHDAFSTQTYYAVEPYPDCDGCLGGLAAFDSLTTTSSHELCEAITDPVPGQGWYDDANGEIGDICAWQTKTIGQYTVQLEWSNQQNACV